MSAPDLIRELSAVGVNLCGAKGKLEVEGPRSVLNQQVLARIRAQKQAILTHLFEERGSGPQGICCLGQGRDSDKAVVARWRAKVEQMPAPADIIGQELVDRANDFLSGVYALEVVKLGWTEVELFGCHETAPLRRHDAMGFIPTLAWSRLGYRVVVIDNEKAVLETRSKSQLTHWRSHQSFDQSVVIWDHPLLETACER